MAHHLHRHLDNHDHYTINITTSQLLKKRMRHMCGTPIDCSINHALFELRCSILPWVEGDALIGPSHTNKVLEGSSAAASTLGSLGCSISALLMPSDSRARDRFDCLVSRVEKQIARNARRRFAFPGMPSSRRLHLDLWTLPSVLVCLCVCVERLQTTLDAIIIPSNRVFHISFPFSARGTPVQHQKHLETGRKGAYANE